MTWFVLRYLVWVTIISNSIIRLNPTWTSVNVDNKVKILNVLPSSFIDLSNGS